MGILNHQPQNFHFVGAPSHCAPFKAPRPTVSSGFSPPHVESPTPHSSTETHHAHEPIDVDSNDEVIRTEKRILWTPEEDLRLMSAWLNNSMDPISGADKRNEQY
uniref:Myb-like domain-containing protein n=1 Tax=Arundo donax TaxID=35708 RepID=A0A0A8Y1L6_ARUDO